jgi:hypothetical protein
VDAAIAMYGLMFFTFFLASGGVWSFDHFRKRAQGQVSRVATLERSAM